MIKLLLVAGATAVVLGGGVALASIHYDQYKNKQHRTEVTLAQKAKAAQYKADATRQDLLVKANQSLLVECEKGVTAYVKLPLSLQRVVPKPVCAPTTNGQ